MHVPIIPIVSTDQLPPVHAAAGSNSTNTASETDEFDAPYSSKTGKICTNFESESTLDQLNANPGEDPPMSRDPLIFARRGRSLSPGPLARGARLLSPGPQACGGHTPCQEQWSSARALTQSSSPCHVRSLTQTPTRRSPMHSPVRSPGRDHARSSQSPGHDNTDNAHAPGQFSPVQEHDDQSLSPENYSLPLIDRHFPSSGSGASSGGSSMASAADPPPPPPIQAPHT
jgi:hypothetical protein